jgi:ribosomal-protein-alanine N-acetyltransferase
MNTNWNDGRLSFAYTQLAELEEIARMLAKESVCEQVFFGPNSSEETYNYFFPLLEPMQRALNREESPDAHLFTIRRQSDGTFVGQCALLPVAFSPAHYLAGYQLDDLWWNKGYGTRSCEFLVWFAFSRLKARRLSGDCLDSNRASARILEKCGFRKEGIQRDYYQSSGQFRDNLLFGLLSEENTLNLEELGRRFKPVTGR